MLDVLVIGSGPAGLSAAVYAKRANLNVLVVEKIYYGTGQIAESSRVDNYLGFAGISGYELGEKFREHASGLGVEFKEAEAECFEQDKDIWRVTLESGEVLETKTVIYAAGAVHRHLGIKGEQEYAGKGVSYCATCDGAFFKNRTVAVVGGGDVALEDAVFLARACAKVYLIHRRDTFRAAGVLQEAVKNLPNVEILYNTTVQKINGGDMVESLNICRGGKQEELCVNGVFIAVGIRPDTEICEQLVNCDENGYILAGEDTASSLPGIFAAGDVRKKPLRQIITAVADGANAASAAAAYLTETMLTK